MKMNNSMFNDVMFGGFESLLSDPYAEHPVVNRHIMNGGGKGSSGGGGQPQQVNSTTTTSNLPEYAKPYFESLMNRAQTVSNDPYQAYGGQRLAEFTGPQNNAFQMTQNNAGQWIPSMNAAAGQFGAAGNANINQVTANQWTDQGLASQYMSPYMQNVTDIGKREALRDYNVQQASRDQAAQQAGAFGGYRHGIVDAEANRNLNEQLQDIQNRGLQSAYETGLGAFNQDRAATMGAAQANNQAALAKGQLQLGAGQAMAGLGQAVQQANLQDIQSLLGVGNMQQAQKQAGLDIAYNDFISQRDYDRQNLNWLSGILRGVPVSANSSVANFQAQPSSLSQIAGLGLGAAGLSKMFS